MRVQLSMRLSAVANMVTFSGILADVGTDHGYIPVFLAGEKRIQRAVAMDINRGPLERAREHIRQFGLEDRIETRLSDGLSALEPGEVDSIVIAGMGGALMERILQQGEAVARTAQELILQPQSEVMDFRRFLRENGYEITAEDMVFEDRKYYPMMRAVYRKEDAGNTKADGGKPDSSQRYNSKSDSGQPDNSQSDNSKAYSSQPDILALKYGGILLEQKHPVLRQYLEWQKQQKLNILKSLEKNARQDVSTRTQELKQELEDINQAIILVSEAEGITRAEK